MRPLVTGFPPILLASSSVRSLISLYDPRVCARIAGERVVFTVELARPLGMRWFAISASPIRSHFHAVTCRLVDHRRVFRSPVRNLRFGFVEFPGAHVWVIGKTHACPPQDTVLWFISGSLLSSLSPFSGGQPQTTHSQGDLWRTLGGAVSSKRQVRACLDGNRGATMKGFILGILFTLSVLVVGGSAYLLLGFAEVRGDLPPSRLEAH